MPELTTGDWTFHWDLFLSPDRPFALVLNLLIATLTVSAVALALRVVLLSLPREERALRRIRDVSPMSRDGVHEAVVGTGTMVEARVRDLRDLSRGNHAVDPEAMSGLTALTMRIQLQVPMGVGRSLIVLGLLGTLWGLGTAVTSLATTLSPQLAGSGAIGGLNTGALAQSILDTLGGMQTAFGTTLTGIAGFLLVGLAVGVARRGQARTLAGIERVMSTRLIPLFDSSEATRLTAVAASLEAMEKRVAEDMQEIVAAIGREGGSLGERLQREFNQIEDAFRRRSEELIAATGKALESTLAIIGERSEGEPTLAEYVRTIRSGVEGLQAATDSAAGLIPQLERRLVESLDQHRSAVAEVFAEHRREVAPIVEKHSAAAELMARSATESAGRTDELVTVLNQFSDAVRIAQETWANTDEMIVNVGKSCREGIDEGLQQVVEQVRSQRQDGASEREAVARHLEQFGRELNQHLERIQSDRRAILNQMQELLDGMRDSVGSGVREVGTALEGRQDRNAQLIRQAIEELTRELRDLHLGPVRNSTRGTGTAWSAPAASVRDPNHHGSDGHG